MGSQDEIDKKREREKIRDITDKIKEKISGGGYIYRGQAGSYRPESDDDGTFPQVTSTLYRALYRKMEKHYKESGDDELRKLYEWREWRKWFELRKLRKWLELRKLRKLHKWLELRKWRNLEHDMNFAQEGVLEAAREFDVENRNMENKDMLSRIQHYSGDTNLIDFTTNCDVALFFACSHKYGEMDGEDGKIFLLKKSKLADHKIEIINPIHPSNRIKGQMSVFLQSRTGFIPVTGLMEVVDIPRELKQPILDDLKGFSGTSLPTIYDDLHGYIRSSKEHGDAAIELYLGLDYNYQYNNAQSSESRMDIAKKAIKHYDKAILLNPKYARAYYSRAQAKKALGLAKSAIDDYCEAIELNSDYAEAYHGCGLAQEMLGNIENLQEALVALKMAKKLAPCRNKPGLADNVQDSIDKITMKMNNP